VGSFDQYKSGKGAEKQFWLSNWSNETIYVDRRLTYADGPLTCPAPFIAVLGCLTPDGLASLRGDERGRKAKDDGFIDRVLLSFPESVPARGEDGAGVSAEAEATLDAAIRELHPLGMIRITSREDDTIVGHRPRVVGLTPCGKTAWQRFTEAHAAEVNAEEFPACLGGAWAKLKGYCGRFALILHYLRWACLERDQPDADVDGDTMHAAVRLVSYFKSHARKSYAAADADPRAADAARLLKVIAGHRTASSTQVFIFSARDAYRWARGGTCKKPDDVRPLLDLIEAHGYVRQLPAPDRSGPGRKPSGPR